MPSESRVIAVTGASGFIGRNLALRLRELGHQVHAISRADPEKEVAAALKAADIVFHLAGPSAEAEVSDLEAAEDFAERVAAAIAQGGRRPLVVCSSSVRAEDASAYGSCRRACEVAFLRLADQATVAVFRLPAVFGKWARPGPGPCVAKLCHDLSRGLTLDVEDPAEPLALVYIDDLVEQWAGLVGLPPSESGFLKVGAVYGVTMGEVADILHRFAQGRRSGRVENVGSGLERALYATFVAALPAEDFSYPLVAHTDPRGSFAEVLKTRDGGQVSVLTAEPGAVRGGHYHHSKVEKFLVVHGQARFRFRHMVSGETYELETSAQRPVVVETIPGWTHDITNIGQDVMVSLLWASEVFDRARPDTVMAPV